MPLIENVHIFGKNLVHEVEEDGSFFPPSEDEVIGMEQLLAEPNCNDLDDDVLRFSSFSQLKYNFEEFSTVEYGFTKIDSDAPVSNLKPSEKGKEFGEVTLQGTNATVLGGRSTVSDTCEDYLLDTEFVDEAFDVNPTKGPFVGNLGSESKSVVSGEGGCGAEISELPTARIPVLQPMCQDSSLLDRMTIGELHEAFRNMFGRKTSITDKQWLKCRLSFGLENLFVPLNDNEGKIISPDSDQYSNTGIRPSIDLFDLRRKPKVQHVKREVHDDHISSKALSSEVSKVVSTSPELQKRLRKPTRRYIEESLEQNSRHQKRRCGISNASSRDKILQSGSYKQKQHRRGSKKKPSVCQKEPFRGACIQVPFGQPVDREHFQKEETKGTHISDVHVYTRFSSWKMHKSEGHKDSRLLHPKVDSDVESMTDSEDDASEDDYSTGTKTKKGKTRRKHHTYWSLSEVLKLVEGVTMYGVGRWTEIKRLLFHSSANRTSVDLKDKWRNLLRASCPQLHSSSNEVGSRKKHASQSIPQSVLRRVRELAAINPYPRGRKSQVSRTSASSAAPIPGSRKTRDNLFPPPTAVRV